MKQKKLDYGQKVKYWVMWLVLSLPFWILITYASENLFENLYQRLFCASMLLVGYLLGGVGGKIIDKFIISKL